MKSSTLLAQQSFFRSAQALLLAVVVGVASGAAGVLVSIGGLVLAVHRWRRIADMRRAQRRRDAVVHDWDARWASWGGRLP